MSLTDDQIKRLANDVCMSDIHSLGTWYSMGAGHTFNPAKYSDHYMNLVDKFIDEVLAPNYLHWDFELRIFAHNDGWACLTIDGCEYESEKWRGAYTTERSQLAVCLAVLEFLDSGDIPTERDAI